MELIDKEKLINEINARAEEECLEFRDIRNMVEFAPTVIATPYSVIENILKQLQDLADNKTKPISFDQSVAVDECIYIIHKIIIESENKHD